jgi:RNA polymerase sigma factor (sigma-70 family)
VVLAEVPLGSTLAGEEVFAAQELGFDPTHEHWALTLLLREPDGEEPSQRTPVSGLPDWDALWRKAYSRLQSGPAHGWQPADWEDMAQEVLLRVIKALTVGTVEEDVVKALKAGDVDEDRCAAWFFTVVKHVAIDYWRTQYGRDGAHTYEAWESDQAGEDVRQAMEVTRVLAGLDVEGLLARTPLLPHERAVVEMTYWYDLTSAEVAHVLGGSAATVRTWHSTALRKLRANAKEK